MEQNILVQHTEKKVIASAIQQQFWLLYQLQPDSPVYNMSSVFHMQGTLDINHLEACCNTLYRQHDILRTTYGTDGDTLYQIVHSYEPLRLSVEEVGQSETTSGIIREEMALPFDLEAGPLVRLRLLRTGINEWYFIITMHHIIADLRSNEIFGEQLSSLYNGHGYAEDEASTATSYADFSVWQREWLSTEKYAKKFSFWKSTLEDSVGLLSLPADHPHPPCRTFRGGAVSVDIAAALTEKIRAFCLQDPYNNTLLTLLSTYACLLYRHSGQEKLRIGVPFTNRRKGGVTDTLGCFVNTLPVVVTLNDTTSFAELIGQLRATMGDVHRNQDVPLTEIDAEIAGRHDPVFQTGFTLTHPMMLSLDGVVVEPLYLHNGGAQMDLFASFWETASEIRGFLEFDADIFDETSIRKMATNFLTILEAAVDNPSGQIGRLPLLSHEERTTIVDEWSGYSREYPEESSLAKMFMDQVKKTPDAVAVEFQECTLRYAQLDAGASRLSAYLRAAGVTPGSMVVLFTTPSIESIVALLGVIKAGAVLVPINPKEPQDRIAAVLQQFSPALILTQQALAATLPAKGMSLLCLDTNWDTMAAASDQPDIAEMTGNTLFYIAFTSGATGSPKAVPVTHQMVCNQILWMQEQFRCTPETSVLQKTAPGYHTWVTEILRVLTGGARLVIPPPLSAGDTLASASINTAKTVTDLFCTPLQLLDLLESDLTASYPALRRLVCTGEPLTPQIRERFSACCTAQLYSLYSLAETAGPVYCLEYGDRIGEREDQTARQVANSRLYVLNSSCRPVPAGVAGDLYVGGIPVCKGYLDHRAAAEEDFITVSHLSGGEQERLFRTGDIVRWQKSGILEFVCRSPDRVPVAGYFPEPAETAAAIQKVSYVKHCSVVAGRSEIKGMVAYIVRSVKDVGAEQVLTEVRRYLATHLPVYRHPSGYVVLDRMPLTVHGTLDRRALPQPDTVVKASVTTGQVAYTEEERKIADIWRQLLLIDTIPADLSFFDASGTSLLAARLAQELQALYDRKVPVSLIFQYPTIRDLAGVLGAKHVEPATSRVEVESVRQSVGDDVDAVAVVGMSCRFPGANSVEEYWQMLSRGEEHISFFEDDKIPADIDTSIRSAENYVRAKGLLDDVEMFDEGFFGFNHQNAAATDPQIRLFLEHSYAALENAGYTTDDKSNSVGVYAGMGRSLYLRYNILPRPDIVEQIGELQIELGHEKDHLPTRVSHSLNLTGPSISVSTACSTSLVAIIMAYQAILRGDCTMALAGGSNIYLPLYRGHLHQEGAFFSKDGHCRPFDVNSSGTTFSDGVGVVVLKKLSKALADNNTIYAVVRGGALNNDGSKKVSYTAPGVEGQVGVITAALHQAGVTADTISYVETHGTATPLGDPIEIEALTQAYRRQTDKRQYCAIGSVKSNIGHTSISAGVASFIKTVLMLHHKKLVPSLYYTAPNPAIDFESSPFYVGTEYRPWETESLPRRAGVSSFGFGGTNAHCILEEAPEQKRNGSSRTWQLLPFSAKSPEALARMMQQFSGFIKSSGKEVLADAAYTLQKGRQRYRFRHSIVCQSGAEASGVLCEKTVVPSGRTGLTNRDTPVIFMYPGQGNQYVNMGKAVYAAEKVYRDAFDRCAEAVHLEQYDDIRKVVFADDTAESHERLRNTYYAQTSIFATEYALSQLWLSWGIRPAALVGHSVGEFCAACIAGIMTLEDAAKLVATRGMLMGNCEPGAMLSIRLPEKEVLPLLTEKLSIAAVNSPQLCVVSGPYEATTALMELCASRNVPCRPLHTSHAFHSVMMEPAVAGFTHTVESIRLTAPLLPIISTVTGELLTDQLATDPRYWTRHMRVTVRFSDAIAHVLSKNTEAVFLETGPRATCCTLARQQIQDAGRYPAIPSIGDGHEPETEDRDLITALGELWKAGLEPDWNALYRDEQRNIVALPSYPFERKRHWIDAVVTIKQQPNVVAASDSVEIAGSVDVKAEEAVSTPQPDESQEDPVIAAIKKMVAEALGTSAASLDADATFLQLGMDSLFLTQMSQRLKTLFGVSVSMRHLMRTYSTIAKLSEFVTREKSNG